MQSAALMVAATGTPPDSATFGTALVTMQV